MTLFSIGVERIELRRADVSSFDGSGHDGWFPHLRAESGSRRLPGFILPVCAESGQKSK
jgi:hypothetical protein